MPSFTEKKIFMSEKEKKSDKSIEKLIESYKGQNQALEKILEKIKTSEESNTIDNEKNNANNDI